MKNIKKTEIQFIVGASSCACEDFLKGTNVTFRATGTALYIKECGLICREIKDTLKPGEIGSALKSIAEALMSGMKSLHDLARDNKERDRDEFIDGFRRRGHL